MSAQDALRTLFSGAGAGWLYWALGALSFFGVALFLERWLFLRACAADPQALAERLVRRLEDGAYGEAAAELARLRAPAARITAAGLRLAGRGPAAAERAMQSAVAFERARLERGLAALGTIGSNAPFLGLLGTVVGVIHAFEALATTGAGGAISGALMASLAEALYATAAGLLVALPAVAAYNYLQRRVTTLIGATEGLAQLLLAYLVGPRGPEVRP